MGRKSLPVLQESHQLKGGGVFLSEERWPPTPESEVPRALKGLARIIDDGLCHRCGSCVGICPTDVLSTDRDEYPEVKNLSACTDCNLCVAVCPGDEFDYKEAHKQVFGDEGNPDDTHGHFRKGVLSHAIDPDIRARGTSGGFITALLLELMKKGEIDGVVSIVSDETHLWKGKPVIARTPAELETAMKSKYAISPTNKMFSEIRNIEGRYVLVGLPCQIHGFVKAAALDRRIKERVVLTVALFCHAAIEHDAFRIIWENLPEEKRHGAKGFVSRIGKHPGSPYLVYDEAEPYPVYFGQKKGYKPTSIEMINILYRLYTPQRCLTCFDGLGEFADIAVGDPWMPPPEDHIDFHDGWSFALIRSKRAEKLVEQARDAGALHIYNVTDKQSRVCNKVMSTEKRWRAFRVIESRRRQGKSIPEYHMESPSHSLKHFILTECNMLSHIFCFLPTLRDSVLRFVFSEPGYWLLYINNKRREFKFGFRDARASWSRKVIRFFRKT